MKRPADKYCSFTREDLGPCGKNGYGYNEDKPCVYLKLNKVGVKHIDWTCNTH